MEHQARRSIRNGVRSMSNQFAIRSIDVSLPMLGEKRLDFTPALDPASHITVLVGRNGAGKSTILREIAMSFRQYFAAKSLNSRHEPPRVCRRLFGLSYAAMGTSSSIA